MSQHPADFLQGQDHAETCFLEEVDSIARDAETLEIRTRALTPRIVDLPNPDVPETNANLMLAVRALEDARLRLRLAIRRATLA